VPAIAIPIPKDISRKTIGQLIAGAANAFLPSLPNQKASAKLYSVSNILARMIGHASVNRDVTIGPVIRSDFLGRRDV